MKKRILIVLLALVILGSTTVGYAYWDRLSQDTNGEYEIGYGVRLNVPTTVQDERILVPAGSFYSAYQADYTTSYVFEYTLTLEDPLQEGMEADLSVDITDFEIAAFVASFNNSESVFTITVGTDEVSATQEADGSWDFEDAFYYTNNTVIVYVTITMADNGNANFDSSDYDFVSGNTAEFAIGFELTNSASSEQLS